MKLSLFNTALLAAATLLVCFTNNKEVLGRTLMFDKQQESGIYSERSWNNNDETDNYQRNAWLADLNEGNRKEEFPEDLNIDCKLGTMCGDPTVLRTPIKKEVPSSSGWSAGGMPFNILYMKNPRPAKSLRSQFLPPVQPTMYGLLTEPVRNQPTGPVPQAQRQYQTLEGEDVRNNEMASKNTFLQNEAAPLRNVRPKGRSSSSLYIPSRRHYSIIPQLFVSYGWGPIPK